MSVPAPPAAPNASAPAVTVPPLARGSDGRLGVAGGGFQRGLVYGSSNSTASEPEDKPVRIEDVLTTVYRQIGINADKELMAPGGRPIEVIDGGEVVTELIG